MKSAYDCRCLKKGISNWIATSTKLRFRCHWIQFCLPDATLHFGSRGGGVPCDQYPWCIGPHHTGIPPPPQTWDLTVPGPHPPSPPRTCDLTPSPRPTSAWAPPWLWNTYGWQAGGLHLLECFLIVHVFKFPFISPGPCFQSEVVFTRYIRNF